MRQTAPVTVVIPTYNGERYINETLKSIRAQSLTVAEVIVVDDGSSDKTPLIAEASGARVIRQSNGGVASARNAGIRAATQPWIAFLDQDDLWEPEKIERQWNAAQLQQDAAIIGCDFRSFDHEKTLRPSFLNWPEMHYHQISKVLLQPDVSYFPQLKDDYFRAGHFLFPSAVMVRRDALIEAGLFDGRFDSIDECDCFLRVLKNHKLVMVEKPLMNYRIHAHNAGKDTLKIMMGWVGIAQAMTANPEKYPQSAIKIFQANLPEKLIEAGRLLLGEKRVIEARELLALSLKKRWSTYASLLWLSTWIDPSSFSYLVKLKRTFLNIKTV